MLFSMYFVSTNLANILSLQMWLVFYAVKADCFNIILVVWYGIEHVSCSHQNIISSHVHRLLLVIAPWKECKAVSRQIEQLWASNHEQFLIHKYLHSRKNVITRLAVTLYVLFNEFSHRQNRWKYEWHTGLTEHTLEGRSSVYPVYTLAYTGPSSW